MSSINFHTFKGTTKVRGSERAYFGITCAEIAWVIIGPHAAEYGRPSSLLRYTCPPNHFTTNSVGGSFAEAFHIYFRVGDGALLLGERKVSMFTLQLNTALYMGSNPVKLAARLHGQCEIHAYVEGKNRKWLAEIIRQGRNIGFYREDMGWEEVIALLEESDEGPVVTSYSVCESFPNAHVAQYPDVDEDEDAAWYKLSREEQWERALIGLRDSGSGLEMSPDNWDGFCFDDGIDANKFIKQLRALYLPTDVDHAPKLDPSRYVLSALGS